MARVNDTKIHSSWQTVYDIAKDRIPAERAVSFFCRSVIFTTVNSDVLRGKAVDWKCVQAARGSTTLSSVVQVFSFCCSMLNVRCATNSKIAGSIPAGVSGFFSGIKSFRSHYGPGVDSASNRNEYQEHFLGVKEAGA